MSKIGKCRRGVRWQYLNINMGVRLINRVRDSGRKIKMLSSLFILVPIPIPGFIR